MALTADVLNRRIENPDGGYLQAMNVASGQTIFAGAAVFLHPASGGIVPTYGIDRPFMGIAENSYTSTALTTDKPVRVRYGHIEEVTITGITQLSLGQLVYATSDNTFTLTAAAGMLVGRVHSLGSAANRANVDFQRYFGLVAMV